MGSLRKGWCLIVVCLGLEMLGRGWDFAGLRGFGDFWEIIWALGRFGEVLWGFGVVLRLFERFLGFLGVSGFGEFDRSLMRFLYLWEEYMFFMGFGKVMGLKGF